MLSLVLTIVWSLHYKLWLLEVDVKVEESWCWRRTQPCRQPSRQGEWVSTRSWHQWLSPLRLGEHNQLELMFTSQQYTIIYMVLSNSDQTRWINYLSPLPLDQGLWRCTKHFQHHSQVSIQSQSYNTQLTGFACAVTKSGFPQPDNPSLNSKQHLQDLSPPTKSLSSLQDVPDPQPQPSPAIILAHTHSLSHVMGSLTDHQHLKAMREQTSSGDNGNLGECFLKAFGYDSEAKVTISNAYHSFQSADKFCDILCPRGFPQAEVGSLILADLSAIPLQT